MATVSLSVVATLHYFVCLSSLALSLPPKIRDQKPRFFFAGSLSACVGAGSFVASATVTGGRLGSIWTGDGLSDGLNTVATEPLIPPIGCRSQKAVGSVPRAKNSVYTIDRLVTSPRSSTTTA